MERTRQYVHIHVHCIITIFSPHKINKECIRTECKINYPSRSKQTVHNIHTVHVY